MSVDGSDCVLLILLQEIKFGAWTRIWRESLARESCAIRAGQRDVRVAQQKACRWSWRNQSQAKVLSSWLSWCICYVRATHRRVSCQESRAWMWDRSFGIVIPWRRAKKATNWMNARLIQRESMGYERSWVFACLWHFWSLNPFLHFFLQINIILN